MEATHTPGPWEAVSNLVRTARTPTGGGFLVAECPANIGSRLEDARLIAAAPELLEACQTFAEWLRREEAGFPAETRFNTPEGEAKWREWFDENMRVCALAQEQARAAIAKATQ